MTRNVVDRRRSTVDSRFALAALLALLTAAPASAALTEPSRLAAVYGSILAAQFDRAETEIAQACPPAPAEACASLRAVSLWWQILLTPESTSRDRRFNDVANAAIAASEAWTRREPDRGEAWFYLAGSYAPLVQWRVLRGERVAAARDGKKIKDALERALQLDPGLDDAHFGIGLYHYYADVAPAAAKLLRWLLFLPGGDRVKGLQEMLQTRQKGALLKGEADYQLHVIYLWYEQQPARAVELLQDLDRSYPGNPLFIQRLAEIERDYFHDRPAAAQAWQTLLERARAGRVFDAVHRAIRAGLALADDLDALYETDRAIELLKTVLDADPRAVTPAERARGLWQEGAAYDRIGDRAAAVKAYNALLALPEIDAATRTRAREALRRGPDANAREAYRLSLEGWRAFERRALEAATTALGRATMLDPSDPVARYRYARVLAARGDEAGAREQLEPLVSARTAPSFVLAAALVASAQLLEQRGDRARAIEHYRAAADLIGGDTRARDEARAALRRLRAS